MLTLNITNFHNIGKSYVLHAQKALYLSIRGLIR